MGKLAGCPPRLRHSDLEDEIAAHLASRAGDLMRAGLASDEARRGARQEFGALDRYREEAREARQPWRLEHAVRDARYAARSLFRQPLFLITAAVSIALGTGVNAVLFSAVRAVLFESPTVTHAERVVRVEPGSSDQFSWSNYRDLRDSGVFEATAGFRAASLSVRLDTSAERADGLVVTADFFDTLGGWTRLGRAFDAVEADADRQPRLAVISHDAWQRRFGEDDGVLRRTVMVNGEPFSVVGVLDRDYVPPTPLYTPEFYVPLSSLMLPDVTRRSNGNALTVLARLREGETPAQASAAVTAVNAELERRFPDDNAGAGRPSSVQPLAEPSESLVELQTLGVVLTLLFALVLLIACANVAGLTLARAATRERELALRAALGATRRRVVQLLLIESLVVASIGTALGLGLATDGFEQAAVAAIVPRSGEASATRFRPEGAPPEGEGVRTLLNSVGTRYFETLGIPLRQGRVFDARDQDGTPPVVVVNERLAQLLFPEENAVGQRIAAAGDVGVEIVGVVGNTKQRSLGEAPQPLLYYAFEQLPRLSSQVRDLHLHVRTPDDPRRHLRRLETIVRERLGADAVVDARTCRTPRPPRRTCVAPAVSY